LEDKYFSQKHLYDFIIRNFKPEVYAYHVVQLLQGMPAADVEPVKHGHWISEGDFEQCSVCKATHLKEFTSYYGKTTWIKTPRCPQCGARMDEKEENKEESVEVKPCPFCSGKAVTGNKLDVEPIIDQNGAYVDANTYYYEWTGCPKCDIWFNIGEDEPEGSTVEKWNRRVNDGE